LYCYSHDIHHQNFGIKNNFSQPFGTIWDHVLGTHMSREEANRIIKMKEERKAARLAALNNANAKGSDATFNKDDDVHSSGNNSGNDSHEEAEADADKRAARRPSTAGADNSATAGSINASSTAVELPGYRERMTTRARVDNGIVSGKGQGKAL
jgi:hypothetical protein